MPLPQMHGRTHIPAGYAAVVQTIPSDESTLLPQTTSDQLRCVAGGAWTGQSVLATDQAISGTGTVLDNTLTTISFADGIFISSGATAFQSGTNTKPIKILLDGWYMFYLNFEWSGGPYTDQRTYSVNIDTLADNCGDANMVQSASAPFINAAYNGTFGPMHLRSFGATQDIGAKVQHNAGSTQTVTSVTLTGLYLGPDIDETFPRF